MFIRLVTDQADAEGNHPSGIFSAAYRLLENDSLEGFYRIEIRASLDWFKQNLPIPTRFARSNKPHSQDDGICWFKVRATECVRQARYLAFLVSENDVAVRELITNAPGYLIYEDDWQVVARPFGSTPQ